MKVLIPYLSLRKRVFFFAVTIALLGVGLLFHTGNWFLHAKAFSMLRAANGRRHGLIEALTPVIVLVALLAGGCAGQSPMKASPSESPVLVTTVASPVSLPAVSPNAPATVEAFSSDVSTPITVRLILTKAPRLNEEVALTFIISTVRDAPDTTATISLPESAVLVSGNLDWKGVLLAQRPQSLEATIMFTREGNWTIEGKALCPLAGGNVWGDAAHIYLYVSKEAGHVGFQTQAPLPSSGSTGPTPPSVNPSP